MQMEVYIGGQKTTATVIGLAGTNLRCRAVLPEASGKAELRVVSVADAADPDRYWQIYKALGGGQILDEDGDPFP